MKPFQSVSETLRMKARLLINYIIVVEMWTKYLNDLNWKYNQFNLP